jgi:hypothetical protein
VAALGTTTTTPSSTNNASNAEIAATGDANGVANNTSCCTPNRNRNGKEHHDNGSGSGDFGNEQRNNSSRQYRNLASRISNEDNSTGSDLNDISSVCNPVSESKSCSASEATAPHVFASVRAATSSPPRTPPRNTSRPSNEQQQQQRLAPPSTKRTAPSALLCGLLHQLQARLGQRWTISENSDTVVQGVGQRCIYSTMYDHMRGN